MLDDNKQADETKDFTIGVAPASDERRGEIYSPFYPCDDLSQQLGLRGHGNVLFSWSTDSYGNPVITSQNANGDFTPFYADWDSDHLQFVTKEEISEESELLTEKKYSEPTWEDYRTVMQQRRREVYGEEEGEDEDYYDLTDTYIPTTEESEIPPDKEEDEDPRDGRDGDDDDSGRIIVSNVGGDSGLQGTITSTGPVIQPESLVSTFSSGTLPTQRMQRSVLLIYVFFNNSKDKDKRMTEAELYKTFTDASTFGTVANYIATNFNGMVDLKVVGNQAYTVTVDYPAGDYSDFASNAFQPIAINALKKVLQANPSIVSEVFGSSANKKTAMPGLWWTGTQRGFVNGWWCADAVNCTPVYVVHGQEKSMSSGSGTANDAIVWAHANMGSAPWSTSFSDLVGVDWSGNVVSTTWDKVIPKGDGSNLGTLQLGTNPPSSALASFNALFDWLEQNNGMYTLPAPRTFVDGSGNTVTINKVPKPKLKYAFPIKKCVVGAFNGTTKQTTGVIIHEMGHSLFNMPDYYDTSKATVGSDDSIAGIGVWSAMCFQHLNKSGKAMGSYPPLYDGFSMHLANPRYTVPITKSGNYTIASPMRPHVIICADSPNECYILQPRVFSNSSDNFKYEKGIANSLEQRNGTFGITVDTSTWKQASTGRSISNWYYAYDSNASNIKPGLLIFHVNLKGMTLGGDYYTFGSSSTISSTKGFKLNGSSTNYDNARLLVMEAHGGTQHMQVNQFGNGTPVVIKYSSGSKWNSNTVYNTVGTYNNGDRKDLFGTLTQNTFGTSTNPDNTNWFKSGKAPFTISNISVDSTGKCTYTINFTGSTTPDPNWDSLPSDPQRRPGFFVLPDPSTCTTAAPKNLTLSPSTKSVSMTRSKATPSTSTTLTATYTGGNLANVALTASKSWVSFSSIGSGGVFTVTMTPPNTGTHTITVTAKDSTDTSVTATATITLTVTDVSLNISAMPSSLTTSSGSSVSSTVEVINLLGTSVNWSHNGGASVTTSSLPAPASDRAAISATFTYASEGTYTTQFTAEDVGSGRPASSSKVSTNVSVTVTAPPLNLTSDNSSLTLSIGASGSVTLTASTILGTGPSFTHDGGSNVTITTLSSGDPKVAKRKVTFQSNTEGVYTVKFTVTDTGSGRSNPANNTASVTVTFTVTAPALTLTSDKSSLTIPVSTSDTVTLTASTILGSSPAFTHNGSASQVTLSTLSSGDPKVAKRKVTFQSNTEGVYNVKFTVTDPGSGRTTTSNTSDKTVKFTVMAPPITLTADKSSVTIPINSSDDVILTASTILGSSPAFTHNGSASQVTLTPMSSGDSKVAKTKVTFQSNTEGVFTVKFTVTDPSSIRTTTSDTDSTTVTFTVTAPPLTVTSDSSAVSLWVKQSGTVTLTAGTLIGSSYNWSHDGDASKVTMADITPAPSGSAKSEVTFKSNTEGVYPINFTIQDAGSGRITDTASTLVTFTVTTPPLQLSATPNPAETRIRKAKNISLLATYILGDGVQWSHDGDPAKVTLTEDPFIQNTSAGSPSMYGGIASSSYTATAALPADDLKAEATPVVIPDSIVTFTEGSEDLSSLYSTASATLTVKYPDEGTYYVNVTLKDLNSGRVTSTDDLATETIKIEAKPVAVTCARERNWRVRDSRVSDIPDIVYV